MAETLLKNNRRAALGLVFVGILVLLLGLIAWRVGVSQRVPIIVWTGFGVMLVGVFFAIRNTLWLLQPRVTLSDDTVGVLLNGFRIERIPLDAVECFFIGQGAGTHAQQTRDGARIENVTVVVRLAQRATEWHERDMDPSLGRWTDGYITIHGLWCEPIDGEFVNEMNHRLAAVKRRRRQASDEKGESR